MLSNVDEEQRLILEFPKNSYITCICHSQNIPEYHDSPINEKPESLHQQPAQISYKSIVSKFNDGLPEEAIKIKLNNHLEKERKVQSQRVKEGGPLYLKKQENPINSVFSEAFQRRKLTEYFFVVGISKKNEIYFKLLSQIEFLTMMK